MNSDEMEVVNALMSKIGKLHDSRIHEFKLPEGATGYDVARILDIPKGREYIDLKSILDQYLDLPERKKGSRELTTLDSFVDYVTRHASEPSVVFLDDRTPERTRLVAIFNAHGEGLGEANWEDFGCTYEFPQSPEWAVWSRSREQMSQESFALLIEDHIRDLIDPADVPDEVKKTAIDAGVKLAGPGKMLALSKGLAINVDAKFAQRVNNQSGAGQLFFKEEHTDEEGNQLDVPGGFAIGIPVYKLGKPYCMAVRLRFRIVNKQACWSLTLYDSDLVLETAVAEAAADVAQRTGVPVFRGG